MDEYQVTCISKPHPQCSHEEIICIGNLADKWRLTLEGAIYQLEKRVSKFYIIDPATGRHCFLEIVKEFGKRKHLKAHLDGRWIDGLLEQPECGEDCKIVS